MQEWQDGAEDGQNIVERHGVTVTGVPWSLTEVGVGWNTGRRRSRICCRAFLSVVANQCSWACFFSESVALAHTLGHTSVHWRTRLLFHHQHHFKANQTRHRDPLEYQRPPCAHSRRTSFLFGSLPAPGHQVSNFQDQQTHTHTHIDLVFTTPSTPSAADAFTKSFLVTTPSKFTVHRATRQWLCGSRPLLHDARLCGGDSDKALTRRVLLLASQIIAYCSPPSLISPPPSL